MKAPATLSPANHKACMCMKATPTSSAVSIFKFGSRRAKNINVPPTAINHYSAVCCLHTFYVSVMLLI